LNMPPTRGRSKTARGRIEVQQAEPASLDGRRLPPLVPAWVTPLPESHLRSILKSWIVHYNGGRPHMLLGPGESSGITRTLPEPPLRHRRGESYAAVSVAFQPGNRASHRAAKHRLALAHEPARYRSMLRDGRLSVLFYGGRAPGNRSCHRHGCRGHDRGAPKREESGKSHVYRSKHPKK
jgi:hypothetical protein